MKKLHFYLILFVSILIFTSCEDPDSSPKSLVNLILVDSPAKWDSVFVEINGVDLEVLVDGRETQSQTFFLEYKSGNKRVKISDLVAGNALLLGRDELPLGQIIGVSILLGDDHSMFFNEREYVLELSEGSDNTIPLATSLDLEQGISYDLILDMDLEKSIIEASESPLTYELDPFFSIQRGAGTVEVRGSVDPASLFPAIYLSDGSDSISTHTDASGNYIFRVQPGNYRLYFDAKDELYLNQSLEIEVLADRDTVLSDVLFVRRP
ncbi:protein of unknown function [Algoriphagus locisalis]|uniref:DUF4382 domain-containing protein n=1 Tax=Algoriphagus locisalis TaxID=305507 RepID=A0A1I7D8U7_9BACT|nr:DUF4382 domain-containing protein [Algoriphagus locisalis]SFU08045.1 protein of unknown function [Algoriphagus locisalis]